MARGKVRSRREVVERVGALGAALRDGLGRLPGEASDPAVLDSLWAAEGLGTLLWAFELAALPPFDRTFDPVRLLETRVGEARLRDVEEIAHTRESARLWHWRARTRLLAAEGELELPPGWQSAEQLIAAAALRGHERGLLPAPLRGDFPAFATAYGALAPDQFAQTMSIAYERHRALNWLCGQGSNWAETPTDT
jgi:hypothetical protein